MMTGRRDHTENATTTTLNTADMPLADRMQPSLVLGDLVAEGAKWAHGRLKSWFAGRADGVTAERPSATCGAF